MDNEENNVLVDYIQILEEALIDLHNFTDWIDLQGHCGKSNDRCQKIYWLLETLKEKRKDYESK